MKAFIFTLLALALANACFANILYQQQSSSGYESSSSSSISSSIGHGSYMHTCCELNAWALRHMDLIHQMENRLRMEYNSKSQGIDTLTYSIPWSAEMLQHADRTASQLDKVSSNAVKHVFDELQRGSLSYETIAQPNYFVWRAAQILEILELMKRPPGIMVPDIIRPVGSTQKQTIIKWVEKNMEPSVVDYQPIVSVGNWMQPGYQPPVHIPVDMSSPENPNYPDSSNVATYPPSLVPGSTVSIRQYNKTSITDVSGTRTSGTEVNKKWVNGKLVVDTKHPFGENTSVTRGEDWTNRERELLFWLLSSINIRPQTLEAWQRQQEERLVGLAERYHLTLEDIHQWHNKEYQRFVALNSQYHEDDKDVYTSSWKQAERPRLDWLIHQNSLTRDGLVQWQNDNNFKLQQLARQYRISLQELKNWQFEELNRLHNIFESQNKSMSPTPITEVIEKTEQERVEELLREHNATIEMLQGSIALDRERLHNLTVHHQDNVEKLEAWLQNELQNIHNLITKQTNEMSDIASWQKEERDRLENILHRHRGSVRELETQMECDHEYLNTLAAKYNVTIAELEKWQHNEMERFLKEGQEQMSTEIKEWQKKQKEHLKVLLSELTVDEFRQQILSDRSRLEDLAKSFRIGVAEVEKWIIQQIDNLKSRGLFKEVEEELKLWQQQERDRLMAIVREHNLTVQELQERIRKDYWHMQEIANANRVQVDEILEWVKKEVERLKALGLIKVEELKEWQKETRVDLLKILQGNYITIEEFEKRLVAEQQRLEQIAQKHNLELWDLDVWIRKEIERLQEEGSIQIQEHLENWKQSEYDRLKNIAIRTKLSVTEVLEKINRDHDYLQKLANQYHVQIYEVREWLAKQIEEEKEKRKIQIEKLEHWQNNWLQKIMHMIRERDYTVEDFRNWLIEDRGNLQHQIEQNNLKLEEVEQWIKTQEERLITLGILKPNQELTDWQEVEKTILERLTQDKFKTIEQLEARLRKDREILEQIALHYKLQVEEVRKWMDKEIQRLIDNGKLTIDNLTAWQLAERKRLEAILRVKNQWTPEELEAELLKDRERLEMTAFKYHTTVEQIEKWLEGEVNRLYENGQLQIEKLTAWQEAERKRVIEFLNQHANMTAGEVLDKVKQDRNFLLQLANQYHISIKEIEDYLKNVIQHLFNKGQIEIENLEAWQFAERDYIKQLIEQYKGRLSNAELEQQLRNDRAHLHQLAEQYRVSVREIEEWMIKELNRLLQGSSKPLIELAYWQVTEVQRIQNLIRDNHHLTFIEFEEQLIKDRKHLQNLADKFSLSVEDIEKFLRQQLLNLKISHEVKINNLAKWQEDAQKTLIEMLLQKQTNFNVDDLEKELVKYHDHLKKLAENYGISVVQIESWMRGELQRLKNSGLFDIELLAWQREEQARITYWLTQQGNKHPTIQEFNEFIIRDKDRIQQIAQQYRISVGDIMAWIQKEAARLRILGQIMVGPPNPIQNPELSIWKAQTRALLEAIVKVKYMTWPDFENFLREQRMRWEHIGRMFNVSVEEIVQWLRQVAMDMVKRGLIQGPTTGENWKVKEQLYIQNLIDDKIRKQQQWSIEELERWLVRVRPVRVVALEYGLSVEVVELWRRQTLQRLLEQGKIISEHLVDWQRREKDRIYWIVMHNQKMTKEQLSKILLDNPKTLQLLANEYRVTTQELEFWICNELDRLVDLGLVDVDEVIDEVDWRRQEINRLRNIAAEIRITEEEFLELIAGDLYDQKQLARMYGIPLENLAPFQRIQIGVLRRDGLLDDQELLNPEKWKVIITNRILRYIRRPNINLEEMLELDHIESNLGSDRALMSQFGVTLAELNYWKVNEFKRLENLAKTNRMSLNQLAEFYENEQQYIAYVMHKMLISEQERISRDAKHAQRIAELERISGRSGERLLAWRRKLYLLCQGRYRSRGDQSVENFTEIVECEEPEVAGNEDVWQQQVESVDSSFDFPPVRGVASHISTMSTSSYSQQQAIQQRVERIIPVTAP